MITIYTDGSAKGNPGPGGWGAIIANEKRVVELGGNETHTTNNRMELTAVIRSLELLSEQGVKSAVINTDSEYVMKGITLWVHSWQKNNWRTAAKKPVLNQDLWQKLVEVSSDKELEWQYVRGHVGHKTNERADIIATSFADNEPVPLYDGPRGKYEYL